MAITEILIPDRLIIKCDTAAASVETIYKTMDGATLLSARPGPHRVVEATGQFSLAGILSAAQATALSGTGSAQAQVATLTAANTKLTADLTALQAKYDAIKPPETIPGKAIAIALAKLELSDAWGKAIDLAVASLEAAKDPNPKRIIEWWYAFGDVNPLGQEWGLVAAEMDKADMWGASSEAALLALAREIAGVAAEPGKG